MSDRSVFIHSTGTLPSMWASVPESVLRGTEKLTRTNIGYPPLAPLPRGERCDIHLEAAHLAREIGDGDEGVHLYAHSYGATVAIVLAKRLGARVRSLFLFDPVLFGAVGQDDATPSPALAEANAFTANSRFLSDLEHGGTDEWLETFIDYWNRKGSWQRLPESMKNDLRAIGWKMFQEVRSCFFDTRSYDDFSLPNVPCTLATGDRTTHAAAAMTQALAKRNPHAEVVVIRGVGHMAPLTNPAAVHDAMAAHAARVFGASTGNATR